MPTASRNVRKNRRIRREKSLAFKSLIKMIKQFEELRSYAQSMRKELDELKPKPELPSSGSLTITKLEDEEVGETI